MTASTDPTAGTPTSAPAVAWVVYESMFGNTRSIAEAIAEGLDDQIGCEVLEVGQAPESLPDDVVLLVAGGPTHAFGMTRPSTRESAHGQAKADQPIVSPGRGLREWLEGLPEPPAPIAFATFDTRVNHPRVPGSAAHGADRVLRRLGLRRLVKPQTFWVEGTLGPVLEGQEPAARAWGESLGALLPERSAGGAAAR